MLHIKKANDARNGIIYKSNKAVTAETIKEDIESVSKNPYASSDAIADLNSSLISAIPSAINYPGLKNHIQGLIDKVNDVRKPSNDINTDQEVISYAIKQTINDMNTFMDKQYFMFSWLKWGHTKVIYESELSHQYDRFIQTQKSANFFNGLTEVSGYVFTLYWNFKNASHQGGLFGDALEAVWKTIWEDGQPPQPSDFESFSDIVEEVLSKGLDKIKEPVGNYWERMVNAEAAKTYFVAATPYAYLINDKKGRSLFMESIEKELKKPTLSLFDDKHRNELYNEVRKAILTQIYDLNKNYEDSYKELLKVYKYIDEKYKL